MAFGLPDVGSLRTCSGSDVLVELNSRGSAREPIAPTLFKKVLRVFVIGVRYSLPINQLWEGFFDLGHGEFGAPSGAS